MEQKPDGFVDPGPLRDGELELVLPEHRWIDAMLAACQHPLTRLLMPPQAAIGRYQWESFVTQHPHGFAIEYHPSGPIRSWQFWMRLHPDVTGAPPELTIAGALGLRLGQNENLEMYLGHIGYHVLPPARGHHYAERACRLVLPLARTCGYQELCITTNPENEPSRCTIERLGGQLVDLVDVPPGNPLYTQGDRKKYRYRLQL